MMIRSIVFISLSFFCAAFAQAQDSAAPAMARELVTVKGGYVEKKKLFEDLRIRAYVPILLKAAGKGPVWKPGHHNWAETEQRIAGEWRKHYLDYMARMRRIEHDGSYPWMDVVLEREYARVFSANELAALLSFYRSPAGVSLLALEREFLVFYPNDIVRALMRMMTGMDAMSEREQASFRSPENRARREFAAMFELENIMVDECARIGDKYVGDAFPLVHLGALATAADHIDALRRKLDTATLADVQAFLKSAIGRKERMFLVAAMPAVTPSEDDPLRLKEEEAAFYKGLQQLSAQWRELAARPDAK